MKVYVVTQSSDGADDVVGVYSTRELALAYMKTADRANKRFKSQATLAVETWIVDAK
jgi:hypothetical protein